MIEEAGTIVRIEGHQAWVDPIADTSCSHCASNASCGSGVISRWLSQKPRYICIENSLNAKEGDIVIIGIKESTMIASAMIMYLLPIISLMIGAGIGEWIGNSFNQNALFPIAGGVVAFAATLTAIHNGTKNTFFKAWFQPVALRIKQSI